MFSGDTYSTVGSFLFEKHNQGFSFESAIKSLFNALNQYKNLTT